MTSPPGIPPSLQLPGEVLPADEPRPAAEGTRPPLVRAVADQLFVNEPNAAFLSRVVFEQLNSYCQGATPATAAPLLPDEVRALVSARADDPAQRFRRLFPAIGPSATVLSLRAATAAETVGEAGPETGPEAVRQPGPAITAVVARPALPPGRRAGTTRP